MSDEQPRPWTPEELKHRFMRHLLAIADEWARGTPKSPEERCHGLAFSILAVIDGCAIELPAIDLVMRPHEDDKAFHQETGENWVEDGTVINADDAMHEEWHDLVRAQRSAADPRRFLEAPGHEPHVDPFVDPK